MNKTDYQQLYNSHKKLNTIGFFQGRNSTEYGPKMLSNFYPSLITISLKDGNEVNFTCSEQFFMWSKALAFKDKEIAQKILESEYNPNKYKRLGRQVKNYDDNKWVEIRDKVMYAACYHKFTQNKRLKDYLLSTDESVLIECNNRDNIWACGLSLTDDYNNPNLWTGENKLGFVLMKIRDRIKREEVE